MSIEETQATINVLNTEVVKQRKLYAEALIKNAGWYVRKEIRRFIHELEDKIQALRKAQEAI